MSGETERVCDLRRELSEFIGFQRPQGRATIHQLDKRTVDGHARIAVEVERPDGERIPAFMMLPDGDGPHPAVLVFHRHNAEWHIGKSEVAGLVGDPLQAFGPALAKRGILVLAPDSVAFEERRRGQHQDCDDGGDFYRHYNEMAYRLLGGGMLMGHILSEAAAMLSALRDCGLARPDRIGVLGHAYGGNTALFHAALDERVAWCISSGAVASYERKMSDRTSLEMALVMPGFVRRWDIQDVMRCISPRPLLVVSADGDKQTADADRVVDEVRGEWARQGADDRLRHHRFDGGHAVTRERFELVVEWALGQSRGAEAR